MSAEKNQLDQLIHACRRDSKDLELPEMEALAAAIRSDPAVESRLNQSHRFDRLMQESLQDVSVPSGLEDRLLATLATTEIRADSLDPDLEAEFDALGPDVVSVSNSPVHRRNWLRWSWAAAAAAVFLVTALVFQNRERTLSSQDDVAIESGKWLTQLSESSWSRGNPPTTHPLPNHPALTAYRWQRVASTGSSFDVVCYSLNPPDPLMRLFVCRAKSVVQLPDSPPSTPMVPSGHDGWAVGGWQASNGLVYVLAVEGGDRIYQRVLRANTNLAKKHQKVDLARL